MCVCVWGGGGGADITHCKICTLCPVLGLGQINNNCHLARGRGGGGGEIAVAQSVGRATPGEEVPDSIPAEAARPLPTGWVGVSIM